MQPLEHADIFDILVLGSGEAGKFIAWTLSSAGNRVALIERQYIGGSCPNIACLPSKNIIHSAKVVHESQKGERFGVASAQPISVDMKAVRERKREMVNGLIEMHQGRFEKSKAELILGVGQFIAPKTLSVQLTSGANRIVTAETVIVSTGSKARVDDIPGLRGASPLTHVEILEIDEVLPHLIILGGGYIGLEFAQAMRRFGSQVTIIEHNSRLLTNEDEDVSSILQEVMLAEGIKISTSTLVDRVEGHSGSSVVVKVTKSGQPFEVRGTHLLVATGRSPNTTFIGLEQAGIEVNARGFIHVDEQLRTTAPGVFAVGDCAGSPNFTHIAYDDFRIVRDVLLGNQTSRSTTGRQVPYTLFADPELARVGLSESEALKRGIKYRLAKLPMDAFLKTRTLGATTGFAKALISASNDRILGFCAVGVGAGDLLAPVQLAMATNLPYTSLRDLILVHPTLSEGLVFLFSSVPALVEP